MSLTTTKRREWMLQLIEDLRSLDKYHVIRGGVNFLAYGWEHGNYVAAVRSAENTGIDPREKVRVSLLEVRAVARMSSSFLDDEVLDTIEEDIVVAVLGLRGKANDKGEALVLNIEALGSVEVNAAEYGIQGWQITFQVTY